MYKLRVMRNSILIIMAFVVLNVTNADAKKFYHYGNTLTFICDDETMTAEVAGTYHVETSGTITVPETFVAKDGKTYTVTAIGDNFLYFDGCPYSKECSEVVLPKTIKSIGKYAFCETNIKSINLPEGLESIGEAAFKGCGNLELAELPSTLKHLGNWAFYRCANISISTLSGSIETLGKGVFGVAEQGGKITSFTFPDHITELPDSMFYDRSGLKEIHLPANLKKIGTHVICYTDITELVVPESVTEIADGAFMYAPLTNVVLPKSLKKVPALAFAGMQIKNLDFLPEGITDIGERAFYESQLEEANIPEGVTTIGSNIFLSCPNLKTVHFPSTLVDVKGWPLDGCPNLKSFTISEDNPSLKMTADSVMTCNVSDGRRLLYVAPSAMVDSTFVLPNDITEIGDNAFGSYRKVNHFEFPEGLRRIGNSNFKGSTIKKVVLPSTLEEMGDEVFSSCESLEEIVLPDKLKRIPYKAFFLCENLSKMNWPVELEEIGEKAFLLANLPSEVILPQSVKHISASAFRGWVNPIENFVLPDGLSTIEPYTFFTRELPNGVVMPNSVRRIGYCAFELCQLKNIVIPEGVEYLGERCYLDNHATQVSLPSTLKYIDKRAFENNNFETVILPDGLKTIGVHAFYNNDCLKEVAIPYGVEVCPYAFGRCTGLEKATFPEDLQIIHPGLFSGCASLKSVVLPNNLIALENEIFDDCSALEEIDFPETLECIGNWVFRGTNLKKADLSHTSLRNIIWEAFADNKSLTEVRLPATCNFVGAKAFAGCDNISVVEVLAAEPPIADAEAFQSPVTERAILIVPDSAEAAYRNAEVWKEFKHIATPTSLKSTIVDSQERERIYDLRGMEKQSENGIYIKGGKLRMKSEE